MAARRSTCARAGTALIMAGVLAAGVAASAVAVYAQPQVGVSAAVRGEVFVTGARNENKRRAQVSDEVYTGDIVETLRQSALQILLLDETVFTVGQNCEMTIDEFVYDPSSGVGDVAATIAKGAFRFITGRIGTADPSSVSLRTPASTIGIRGTIGEGAVGQDAVALCQGAGLPGAYDPSSASLIALRGPGQRRNSFDKYGQITVGSGGQQVTLAEPGFGVCVPASGQPPIGPFKLTAEMLAYFDRWLRSTPVGPGIDAYGITETAGDLSQQNKFNDPTNDTDVFPDPRGDAGFDDQFPDPFCEGKGCGCFPGCDW